MVNAIKAYFTDVWGEGWEVWESKNKCELVMTYI
jgi:hypothetical protein